MMYEEFFILGKQLQIPLPIIKKTYDVLVGLYAQPHRRYHNLTHVKNCLDELDDYPYHYHKPTVHLAVWFHDAIYEIAANNNEEKSAELADTFLQESSSKNKRVYDLFSPIVRDLIMATKHTSCRYSPEEALIVDVDLSILGKDWNTYRAYETTIRLENANYSDDVFIPRRIAFLESLLKKERIFSTHFFHSKYDVSARKNMERSKSYWTEFLLVS